MPIEPSSSKRALRARFHDVRRAIAEDERRARQVRTASELVSMLRRLEAQHVATYQPKGGEIDPGVSPHRLGRLGISGYYPVWHDGAHEFVSPETGRRLAPDDPHVVMLVPGLAFDLKGNRLGRGGGWYDRTLSCFPGAVRVGVAFDEQIVERLPTEPWDVSMHFVMTDARLIVVDGPSVGAGECAHDPH